jgi:hypothetical protein
LGTAVVVRAPSSGFDWEDAFVGALAGMGSMLLLVGCLLLLTTQRSKTRMA